MPPSRLLRVRLRQAGRLPFMSYRQWARRLVFWAGAIVVAAAAIAFAALASLAEELFLLMAAPRPWVPWLLCPAGTVTALLVTRHAFPGAGGSGIPQVIAAQQMVDPAAVARALSLRIVAGKVALIVLALCCGASIGRAGPTVLVGAALMVAVARLLRPARPEAERALILAGGAAGLAAAFNAPLAGIFFAIEELGGAFASRNTAMVLTAAILAGMTTFALVGNHAYFGQSTAALEFGRGWVAVALCGAAGGLAGGLFGAILLRFADGLPGRAGQALARHPVAFAALCGLLIAAIGAGSGGETFGTGYAQARRLVEGVEALPGWYFLLKFAATVASYVSGIPAGVLAPSLSVGAGLGGWLAQLPPIAPMGVPLGAVVLLGMVGYLAGVSQAPITATVIVIEMTDNQALTVPLLATSFIAFGISRLICRRPLYVGLARRYVATA